MGQTRLNNFNESVPISCWNTFHAKEGTGRSNHTKIKMIQETNNLNQCNDAKALSKKLEKEKKKLKKYSAQKKKLSKRRSGGFKVKPTNQDGATAETKGVDNDATEKEK